MVIKKTLKLMPKGVLTSPTRSIGISPNVLKPMPKKMSLSRQMPKQVSLSKPMPKKISLKIK